jgi:hypothetical protein
VCEQERERERERERDGDRERERGGGRRDPRERDLEGGRVSERDRCRLNEIALNSDDDRCRQRRRRCWTASSSGTDPCSRLETERGRATRMQP